MKLSRYTRTTIAALSAAAALLALSGCANKRGEVNAAGIYTSQPGAYKLPSKTALHAHTEDFTTQHPAQQSGDSRSILFGLIELRD